MNYFLIFVVKLGENATITWFGHPRRSQSQVSSQLHLFYSPPKNFNLVFLNFVIFLLLTKYFSHFYAETGIVPDSCKGHLDWAINYGKDHLDANLFYPQMEQVTGVSPKLATIEDFQRMFKCNDNNKADCNEKGLQFPQTCTFPPCNQCYVLA